MSIFINPRDALPTVSAERCHTLHLHCIQPKSLGSVYTVQCSDITVHFKPPHKEEYILELPSGGTGNDQFVSSLSGEEMVTEKVIRGKERWFNQAQGLSCGDFSYLQKVLDMLQRPPNKPRQREEKKNVYHYSSFLFLPSESLPPSLPVMRRFEEHLLKTFNIGPPPSSRQPPPTTDTNQPPDTTGENRDKA